MSQVDNFVKARGRRVRIYDYNGRMQIDHKKLIGSVGIMLQQDENTAVIFCPAVNSVYTLAFQILLQALRAFYTKQVFFQPSAKSRDVLNIPLTNLLHSLPAQHKLYVLSEYSKVRAVRDAPLANVSYKVFLYLYPKFA